MQVPVHLSSSWLILQLSQNLRLHERKNLLLLYLVSYGLLIFSTQTKVLLMHTIALFLLINNSAQLLLHLLSALPLMCSISPQMIFSESSLFYNRYSINSFEGMAEKRICKHHPHLSVSKHSGGQGHHSETLWALAGFLLVLSRLWCWGPQRGWL